MEPSDAETAQKTAALGSIVTLQSATLALTLLPERGALACSLVHRPSQTELLRRPASLAELDAEPFTHGIPILFPAGRMAGAQCTVDGHAFHWPVNDTLGPNHLHGFLWNIPWQVREQTGHRVRLEPTDRGMKTASEMFGAAFSARIVYTLDDACMESRLTIANRSRRAVPFGAGYHTSIALSKPWLLQLPVGREWEMDRESLPTGHLLDEPATLVNVDRALSVPDLVSDTCYRPEPGPPNVARLWDPQSGLAIAMEGEAPLSQWVVYRPNLRAPFVSVEPVTWVHNAPNLSLPAALTGNAALKPGEERSLTYRWTVTAS
ncbi:MAG: hypothetical protein M0Z54_10125 [Thermaerobacter sp.]|nr:hypothetical protein [Thermaerobacter sp.]